MRKQIRYNINFPKSPCLSHILCSLRNHVCYVFYFLLNLNVMPVYIHVYDVFKTNGNCLILKINSLVFELRIYI